jgi:hypothetical protein
MEAARAAALRGHKVVLAEAAPKLGGALEFIRHAPKLATLGDYRQWIEAEVFRLGVDVRTSTYLEAEDIRSDAPDVLIVATGASPDLSGFQVAMPSLPMVQNPGSRVLSSIDLLQELSNDWGRSAVVYDDLGDYEAIACAEYLIERGIFVTFVTRHAMFGQMVEATARAEPALDRLGKEGRLRVVTRARIACASRGTATIKAHGHREETVAADTVVFVGQKIPNSDIYDRLFDTGVAIQRVGDVLAPRDLQAAIRDGHLAGRAIA